ncbi:uncharacterized protein BO97DRAFT_422777 [Aspergillus homomorphus CBS 101889]|uniref:Uncharacterized protein n=1 Tax=Aspergillus homomorphus (strain CBS 101889) TaxID=1450537 RepID=A0A395I3R6_ASPHC|nr:hypothetical protein BO97DRAFT_422777 [Aspergillus homomorphus CBS 101889]RAL14359.1 hypothetical protein BO97DRAFT_422777 [Aspergillus homomorphus CBS 101889]
MSVVFSTPSTISSPGLPASAALNRRCTEPAKFVFPTTVALHRKYLPIRPSDPRNPSTTPRSTCCPWFKNAETPTSFGPLSPQTRVYIHGKRKERTPNPTRHKGQPVRRRKVLLTRQIRPTSAQSQRIRLSPGTNSINPKSTGARQCTQCRGKLQPATKSTTLSTSNTNPPSPRTSREAGGKGPDIRPRTGPSFTTGHPPSAQSTGKSTVSRPFGLVDWLYSAGPPRVASATPHQFPSASGNRSACPTVCK